MKKVRVLFCCMGNICRSPLAHGLFEHKLRGEGMADWVEVDSAGTHSYHVGACPDPRSQDTAKKYGFDISEQRARQAIAEDFERFDYVIAMDRDNHALLAELCPAGYEERLHLFLDFAPGVGQSEVPDPYYGGRAGFDRVYELVAAASEGLLEDIRRRYDR